MEWLEPWTGTQDLFDESFHRVWLEQLQRELSPGHPLYGLPLRLIARGNGDDALFEVLDGSGRVVDVHLTWSTVAQTPPWPGSGFHPSQEAWRQVVMIPQHADWLA